MDKDCCGSTCSSNLRAVQQRRLALSPYAIEGRHDDPDLFTRHGDKNIHRAISLVPQEMINLFDLDVERYLRGLYLRDHEFRDLDREHRSISHAQIELIAARASSVNSCFY